VEELPQITGQATETKEEDIKYANDGIEQTHTNTKYLYVSDDIKDEQMILSSSLYCMCMNVSLSPWRLFISSLDVDGFHPLKVIIIMIMDLCLSVAIWLVGSL